jgi:hypothetical protein
MVFADESVIVAAVRRLPPTLQAESAMHDTRLLIDCCEEASEQAELPTARPAQRRSASRGVAGADALSLFNRSPMAAMVAPLDIVALSVASCIGVGSAPSGRDGRSARNRV